LLESENQVVQTGASECSSPSVLLGNIRALLAKDSRNKAAGETLERYYQLADAETRGEMVLDALLVLDTYRPLVREANPRYTRVPLPDADELDKKRAEMLAVYSRAEEGSQLLNINLKRRLGLPGTSTDRLWPTVDLSVDPKIPETEELVKNALENRADLQALRLAYLELNVDTLDGVRGYFKSLVGPVAGGIMPGAAIRAKLLDGLLKPKTIDPALVHEVAVRKMQLFELVGDKERAVADEVRALCAGWNAQTKRVALARWKLDQALKKWKETKEKNLGPLAELPLELMVKQAQADVVGEAAQWHGIRIRLQTAIGAFND
jgi:hypothetical protein